MSIDARVTAVAIKPDGSGKLHLIDRPARPGRTPGIAGQPVLCFGPSPGIDAGLLVDKNIWGGASDVMLGDREIALRSGYTSIVFHDPDTFRAALAQYHNR